MKKQIITFLALIALTFGATARQPESCYRGFIDWSNSLRSEKNGWGHHDTEYYTGLSTSHGYQFKIPLFIGAGIDYEYCKKWDSHILAPFIQGRTDLKFGKFTPFGDVRIGYNLTNGGGIYFSPSIGYRFNWGRKAGLNIGVGMTLQGYSADVYDIAFDPGSGYWHLGNKLYTHHGCLGFFSFRLGFDF